MSTIKLLENYLKFSSTKNHILSKNISNIGTKNYQRQDVVFKNVLNNQLDNSIKTSSRHHLKRFGNTGPDNSFEIITDKNEEKLSGINNVDIEKEMVQLAENTINFKLTSKKVRAYYNQIREAIRGNR